MQQAIQKPAATTGAFPMRAPLQQRAASVLVARSVTSQAVSARYCRSRAIGAAPVRASYGSANYGPVGGDARCVIALGCDPMRSTRRECPPSVCGVIAILSAVGDEPHSAHILHMRRIKVIGAGGGGGNAVNRMIQSGLSVSALFLLAARVSLGHSSLSEQQSYRPVL